MHKHTQEGDSCSFSNSPPAAFGVTQYDDNQRIQTRAGGLAKNVGGLMPSFRQCITDAYVWSGVIDT